MADYTSDHVTVGVTIETTVLTPEQISERIGMAWDKARWLGDPRGHLGKQWDHHGWQVLEHKQGSENQSAHELLPLCVTSIIDRLKPIASSLRTLSDNYGAEFFIHVTAKSVPGIGLDPEAIRVIADAGLSLDVDIILYADKNG